MQALDSHRTGADPGRDRDLLNDLAGNDRRAGIERHVNVASRMGAGHAADEIENGGKDGGGRCRLFRPGAKIAVQIDLPAGQGHRRGFRTPERQVRRPRQADLAVGGAEDERSLGNRESFGVRLQGGIGGPDRTDGRSVIGHETVADSDVAIVDGAWPVKYGGSIDFDCQRPLNRIGNQKQGQFAGRRLAGGETAVIFGAAEDEAAVEAIGSVQGPDGGIAGDFGQCPFTPARRIDERDAASDDADRFG